MVASRLAQLYGSSLTLLNDLYQLTMAFAYWKSGMADREAVFHLFFRRPPFQGGFTLAGGLTPALEYLEQFRFDSSDLDYLAGLQGNDGLRLFEDEFLQHLSQLKLTCDIDAIPEGTVVYPHEPLVRVRGPLLQCQLLETPLLNIINFQSLVATRAARICLAARGEPVIEFGTRRAQGIDGGVSASRAAYLGGCAATSNVLAGKLFGIPVRGTHAHSWVMAFENELEAFRSYARALPNNCIFLVDTYDSIRGVERAIEVGRELRRQGHEMIGIRLDSGDLADLSIQARKLLDEAGFEEAVIVASNNLDEHIIASLKDQGARIGVWGVGTRLATASEQPALGGVYKMSAIRSPAGQWQYKIKLSEQAIKVNIPGILQVRRFQREGRFLADAIFDEELNIPPGCTIVDPFDSTRRKTIPAGTEHADLLEPVVRAGERSGQLASLPECRARVRTQLQGLDPGVKRFLNPAEYPVGLEMKLYEMKKDLVLEARRRQEKHRLHPATPVTVRQGES